MKKTLKHKKYTTIAIIAIAVIALSAGLIGFQASSFQGNLSLKPSAGVTIPVGGFKPVSGEPGPYSGEVVTGTINKAELAKLLVATLNVDVSKYKACAPDVIGQWFETYACYMASRNPMWIGSDGLFHGDATFTRADASKFFAVTFVKPADWYTGNQVVFKDVAVNTWYYVYVMTLAQKKVLDVEPILPNQKPTIGTTTDKGLFSPATNMTQKAATIWAQNVKANLLP